MKNLSQRLGARICHFRTASGWTQCILAKKAGLTNGYLSAVERGKTNISVTNLDGIAVALGVPLATLLDCEDADHDALITDIDATLRALPADALRMVRIMACLLRNKPKGGIMSLNSQILGKGEERYQPYETYQLGEPMDRRFAGQTRVQYIYRHTDGELFSCVAPSLDEARARRDAWMEARSCHD